MQKTSFMAAHNALAHKLAGAAYYTFRSEAVRGMSCIRLMAPLRETAKKEDGFQWIDLLIYIREQPAAIVNRTLRFSF